MVYSAKNYTRLSKKFFQSENIFKKMGDVKDSSMNFFDMLEQKHISTIFFTITIIVFMISLSYLVMQTQNTQSSQASYDENATQNAKTQSTDTPVETKPPEYKYPLLPEFPSSYKQIPIDKMIYTTGKQYYSYIENSVSDKLIIDETVKYFTFRDALVENGFPLENIEISRDNIQIMPLIQSPSSFTQLEYEYFEIEPYVQEHLISHRDFYYFIVRFVQNTEEENKKVEERLRKKQKEAAKELTEKYRSLIAQSPDQIEQIFTDAGSDKQLMELNKISIYKNAFREHYTKSDELIPTDNGFNTFLFSQKEKIVSEVYEYKGPLDTSIGFIFVFPTQVVDAPYDSQEGIVSTYIEYFE